MRGYPTYTIRGEASFEFSNEIRLPAVGLAPVLKLPMSDRFEPFLFLDYATLSAHGSEAPYAGILTSAGPGVRLTIDGRADLVVDAGAQIRTGGGHTYPAQFFDAAVVLHY